MLEYLRILDACKTLNEILTLDGLVVDLRHVKVLQSHGIDGTSLLCEQLVLDLLLRAPNRNHTDAVFVLGLARGELGVVGVTDGLAEHVSLRSVGERL